MLAGILFALGAGLMWGLIFVGPLLVPDYPGTLQSMGRYLAFGLIALPLAWQDRQRLRGLTGDDWREAFKLTLVGNLLYYAFLATAIQRTGAPVSTMIIGTLPLALLGYLLVMGQLHLTQPEFTLPFGPQPGVFIALMLAIGLFCSWLGTLCWNEASQRLPAVLLGPLIVFETLAGLAYTFALRQAWPPLLTFCGIICLISGVVVAMRIKPQPRIVPLNE
ncbi:EamA family transporter [Pantoea coffeiphila]|uniref:EamA domain-containing protein n=1 Tax=Pantoea coffeiphila TaxID=1465635 RepID=A0A2S9IE58_9GAMM|nr:EamA family transporter [Pantoea coffeiphila]PRD16082.1 hypothetical protein CQW29_08095 [Pantoea coffeiphila]